MALVPLLWTLRRATAPRGALAGLAFGLVYYGVLLSWLLRFGVVAWAPLVVTQAAYAGAFGAVGSRLLAERAPVRSAAAVAALWTALDWVRGMWPLGGFTWGGLGYTQHDNGLLLPLASVTGVWGVTFVVVAVNALLLAAAARWRVVDRAAAVRAVAVAVAALVGPAAIPLLAGPGSGGGAALDVAVVQGNVSQAEARDFYIRTRRVALNHVSLHRELAARPPELAVWPENSLDVDPFSDPDLGERVRGAIRAVGSPTIVGAITEGAGERIHNTTLLYSGRGEVLADYHKLHLVPFGEYVPFRRWFGWVDQLRAVPRDLTPGRGIELFEVDGVRIGTPICFENIFPDLFRRFVAKGADLVVVATNDSSYADSPASREHVIMSELRAVETGRWIVQAAISGESAIVDPTGTVRARTELFTRTILRGAVPALSGATPYVRWGDWFPLLCGIGAPAAVAAWARARRRERPPWSPPAGESEDRRSRSLPVAGGAEPRTLVVLPTYDEAGTIAAVVAGVLEAGPTIDVLVVDDRSPDGTAGIVAALAEREPRVRLLVRRGKLGLASAYLAGFDVALDRGYDLIVEMDADLSHRPEELPRLLAATARYDVVIGSRYVPGGGVTNWSRARLALSRAGNAYARTLLGLPVRDATSGYRAFRRSALRTLLAGGIGSEGYAFQIELAYRAWRAGLAVGEVPITFREREHGRSKISRRIVAEALWQVARWAARDRLGPLRRLSPGRSPVRAQRR